jgi:hypothetical protein
MTGEVALENLDPKMGWGRIGCTFWNGGRRTKREGIRAWRPPPYHKEGLRRAREKDGPHCWSNHAPRADPDGPPSARSARPRTAVAWSRPSFAEHGMGPPPGRSRTRVLFAPVYHTNCTQHQSKFSSTYFSGSCCPASVSSFFRHHIAFYTSSVQLQVTISQTLLCLTPCSHHDRTSELS